MANEVGWDSWKRVEWENAEKGRERSVQPQLYPPASLLLPLQSPPLLYLPFPVHIALSAEKGPAAAAMFSEIMRTEEKADYGGEQLTLSAFYELERIKVTS